ncbi:MAG: hypothetical protein WKG07_42515 [Hymenobacter sp.]
MQVGGGFAGAGLGAGNQVFAGEDFGDGLLLNGRGLLVVHGVHAGQQVVVEVKFVKRQGTA